MKFATLFSGGKDSTFATAFYQMQGWECACLITLKSKNKDSYMFHTPNIQYAKMQAEAMGIPIIEWPTAGEKEKELADMKAAIAQGIKKYKIQALVAGALFSDYQQERVNRICEELHLKCFVPLWHKNQTRLMQEMIDAGFTIILQKVAAEGLDASWLNKPITHKELEQLIKLEKKYRINVAGEGGEFESFVIDGPLFKKKIEIQSSKIVKDNYVAQLIIEKARLIDKNFKK